MMDDGGALISSLPLSKGLRSSGKPIFWSCLALADNPSSSISKSGPSEYQSCPLRAKLETGSKQAGPTFVTNLVGRERDHRGVGGDWGTPT